MATSHTKENMRAQEEFRGHLEHELAQPWDLQPRARADVDAGVEWVHSPPVENVIVVIIASLSLLQTPIQRSTRTGIMDRPMAQMSYTVLPVR